MRHLTLLLICTFSFGAFAGKSPSPLPATINLPDCAKLMQSNGIPLNLDYGRDDLEKFFQANSQVLSQEFDHARLTELVNKVAGGEALNGPEYHELIEFRTRLKELRFAFILFDKNHDYPPFIDAFTKTLGKVKDALLNDKLKLARAKARELSVLMQNENWAQFDDELASFQPSSGQGLPALH